jgi:8-oxo-dGTP pyrophosphatase MutT (NUDIX family)|tara:strand:- start:5965 stop:6426 length:462 start_codon:yes stop_codon:yes gene_type:complete
MKKIIKAAGGLVINKNEEILFIHRRGHWDLPKGKVDLGESIEETAVREVSEETGIPFKKLKLHSYLTDTRHVFLKENFLQKETSWFVMKTKYSGKLVPDENEGIERCEWINQKEVSAILLGCSSRVRYLVNYYLDLCGCGLFKKTKGLLEKNH